MSDPTAASSKSVRNKLFLMMLLDSYEHLLTSGLAASSAEAHERLAELRAAGDVESEVLDTALLDAHMDTAERCLAWIDAEGDRDGDGFQEYQTRAETQELYIPPGPRLGGVVVELDGVSKSYGDRVRDVSRP